MRKIYSKIAINSNIEKIIINNNNFLKDFVYKTAYGKIYANV